MIVAQDLSKHYRQVEALEGLNLMIRPGETPVPLFSYKGLRLH
jgi:ABC-type multidrug transport system ATPase subunit